MLQAHYTRLCSDCAANGREDIIKPCNCACAMCFYLVLCACSKIQGVERAGVAVRWRCDCGAACTVMDLDSVANPSIPTPSCISLYSAASGDAAEGSSVSGLEEESRCISPLIPTRRARGELFHFLHKFAAGRPILAGRSILSGARRTRVRHLLLVVRGEVSFFTSCKRGGLWSF